MKTLLDTPTKIPLSEIELLNKWTNAIVKRSKISKTPWDVLQWRDSNGKWNDCTYIPLFDVSFISMDRFRIKPKTLKINGNKIGEPLQIEDALYGTKYWSVDMFNMCLKEFDYTKQDNQNRAIKNNIVFRTEGEAASLLGAYLGILHV
jgi:hypothetical protein